MSVLSKKANHCLQHYMAVYIRQQHIADNGQALDECLQYFLDQRPASKGLSSFDRAAGLAAAPFWMQASRYIWCTLFAFLVVVFFRRFLVHLNNTIFWFDCIGLGLFVVVGYEKSLALDYPVWVCVSMATITGIFGGIIRDILINEVPIVFTQELYAVACILGGLLFSVLHYLNVDLVIIEISTAVFVVVIRILATKYRLKLPILKGED